MNGLVSSSSAMVEGIVGKPAFRWFRAHDNFSAILVFSGSTVKANWRFFTVYWLKNRGNYQATHFRQSKLQLCP